MGNKIKNARTVKHMTQEELAWRSGVDTLIINEIEDNRRHCVSCRTVKAIADALEMTIEELFR